MRRTDDGMDGPEADDGRRAVEDDVEHQRHALDEAEQRYLRLCAELDNFRRRASREQELARRDRRRTALLPLLSGMDSFERRLSGGTPDSDFNNSIAPYYA